MNMQTVTNDYSYMLINHNLGFHAGVKGVSERSELTPCKYYNSLVIISLSQASPHPPPPPSLSLGTTFNMK